MRKAGRILILAATLVAVSSVASGYAHWVFYSSRSAPFNPVPAIFNIGNLTNNTVSYFISDQTPGPLMPGDSIGNILSQIQAAAAVWNQVPTSAIRVAFGGFASIGGFAGSGSAQAAPQATPGIDVVFNDDVTPGLLAQTMLTLPADLSPVANSAPFVPIQRATITLRRNLTQPFQLASYYDLFYMIVVHEFGHALGLQHTLTSGVMSTQVTSATTKAAPLSPDDVAGISLLYPTQNYAQGVGSISGTVLVAGKSANVNMANVVAISANGTAVSSLTNPDGTFLIQGVPPGQYYVYAGPLPPAQTGETAGPDNIVPPEDAQGNPFYANTGFDTEFFGGTRDWTQAGIVTVSAGQTAGGVNFNLQQRSGPAISYIETLVTTYYGAELASPSIYPGNWPMELIGPGITTSNGLVKGLSVTAIGAATVQPNSLSYYKGNALVTVNVGPVQTPAPVALVVTLPNDMYVLPYAFFVVPDLPPWITGVTGTTDALGNTTVNLTGANLNAGTSVVFDGAPATVTSVNADGSLTVAPPPASTGYTAYIEALSADGQTSWQDLGTNPRAMYTFGSGSSGSSSTQGPSMFVNSGLLLPGATAMLDIIGVGTSFVRGQVSIGLGSSDITVGQIWVLGPQRVLANVTVSPQAQPGLVDVTVTSGLQTLTLPAALQVQAANPSQMTLLTPILNAATGLDGTPAGGVAIIPTSGLPQNLSGWILQVDGVATAFQMGNSGLITAQIPAGLPQGVAAGIVQLIPPNSTIVIPPVVMQVDGPDPQIVAVANASGALLGPANPVHIGDTVTVSVTGLTQSPTGAGLSNTEVVIGDPVGGFAGGAIVTPVTILPGPQTDAYQIQFKLGSNVPFGPKEELWVGIGTRISAPVNIFILPQQ